MSPVQGACKIRSPVIYGGVSEVGAELRVRALWIEAHT